LVDGTSKRRNEIIDGIFLDRLISDGFHDVAAECRLGFGAVRCFLGALLLSASYSLAFERLQNCAVHPANFSVRSAFECMPTDTKFTRWAACNEAVPERAKIWDHGESGSAKFAYHVRLCMLQDGFHCFGCQARLRCQAIVQGSCHSANGTTTVLLEIEIRTDAYTTDA